MSKTNMSYQLHVVLFSLTKTKIDFSTLLFHLNKTKISSKHPTPITNNLTTSGMTCKTALA